LVLSVAPDSSVVVGVSLLSEAFLGRVELEWPEEVVSLLEVRSKSDDLVNEVLNAGNTELSESLLNDGVVSERDSVAVGLTVTSLVDQLSNGGVGWVAISNIRLNSAEHVDGGLVQSDEDSVVQLSKSEELHDLLALGVELVDTKRNE